MPTPLIITIIVLGVLLIFLFVFTVYAYSVTFRRKKRPVDAVRDLGLSVSFGAELTHLSEKLRQIPFEEVRTVSHDGLILVGRYYEVAKGAPVHILFHGYNSSPVHDFCASVSMNLEDGHNVLLVYQRAHGRSEGHTLSFGHFEKYDVLAWVRYAIEREGEGVEILLAGISMGAATVILSAALDLPENVKCAIVDCPYSTAKEVIMLTAKRMGFPPKLVYPFIRLGARIFGRFDPDCVSVENAAKNLKIPVMLMHGEDDRFVPKYMSDKISAASGGLIEYHTFEGADHGMSALTDTERNYALCYEFTDRYIKGNIKKS